MQKKRERRLEKDRRLFHDVRSAGAPLVPGVNLPREGSAKMHRTKKLYEIALKTFNTKAIHLPRRGKFILGSEHTLDSFYWQNTLEYKPPSPHTKVLSVLVSEGWAKAVGRGVGGVTGGGLRLAVVLLKVGLFLSHKVCKNVPMLARASPQQHALHISS